MKRDEIIASPLEQARDKDALANDDPDSVFTSDALALREAALLLTPKELTRVTVCPFCGSEDAFTVEPTKCREGGVWLRCGECGLHGVLFR